MDGLKQLEGKDVYIETKSGRKYSGIVSRVEDSKIYLIDKYDLIIVIDQNDLSILQEERR